MAYRNLFDDLDRRIITELHEDARKSASEIARKTGSHERTIRKRIDRLLEIEAIRLVAVVNPAAFGYATTVDVFLKADPEQEAEIIKTLLEIPEISYMAINQGSRDISIEARFKDNDKMREFVRYKLPAIPGVRVSGYALVPKILRNIDEWLPVSSDFDCTPHGE